MREDMDKVLVESPRSGRGRAAAHQGSRRQYRQRLDRDGESAPQHLGMRRDALDRKHFGEHLSPLYRYLRQQVNRPWNKVYGELCAQLDRRNVIQAHLFQHIDDKVAVDTLWHEGDVWVRRWRELVRVGETRVDLFVHPRTGILLPNRGRALVQQRERAQQQAKAACAQADRRVGLPGMAADCQWHRVDGVWYAVTLAPLDPSPQAASVYDVLLKRLVDGRQRDLLRRQYGCPSRYATAKRQLASAALRAHGLVGGA